METNVRETVIVKYVRRARRGSTTRCVDILLIAYDESKNEPGKARMRLDLMNYKAQKLVGARISRKDETVMAQGIEAINSTVKALMGAMGKDPDKVDILLI